MIFASKEFWYKFDDYPTLWKTHWFISPLKRKWRWLKQNGKTDLSFNQYINQMRPLRDKL